MEGIKSLPGYKRLGQGRVSSYARDPLERTTSIIYSVKKKASRPLKTC